MHHCTLHHVIVAAHRFAIALGVVGVATAQTTWTVDIDPAAGADFTQIQPAVDAASAGDVVLVGSGWYERVEIDKSLRVIGTFNSATGTPATIIEAMGPGGSGVSILRGIPASSFAVLADIHWLAGLVVQDCDGVVLLDACRGILDFSQCVDLRVRATSGRIRLLGGVSWVEFNEARSFTTAFWLTSSAPSSDAPRIHISNPRVHGASGYTSGFCFGGWYVDGFPAMGVASAQISVAGRATDFISGGSGASGGCWTAWGASAVFLDDGWIRHSGADIRTGDPLNFPVDIVLGATAAETTPARIDPSLRIVGESLPGAPLQIEVDAEPGDWVRLELGRGPANVPSPGSPVPRLVTPGRLFSLGEVPMSGTVVLPIVIPPGARPGDVYWLQAAAVTPSGEGRRTNSLAIVVR